MSNEEHVHFKIEIINLESKEVMKSINARHGMSICTSIGSANDSIIIDGKVYYVSYRNWDFDNEVLKIFVN